MQGSGLLEVKKLEYQDKDGDTVSIDMIDGDIVISLETYEDTTYSELSAYTARAIALELIRLADEIDNPAAKIGKRYLTRDWKVVRYDGTQDVRARG